MNILTKIIITLNTSILIGTITGYFVSRSYEKNLHQELERIGNGSESVYINGNWYVIKKDGM